jgi:cytochrome c biogenesis protein CcmG/thiol:disulfide interchange protein DsbE
MEAKCSAARQGNRWQRLRRLLAFAAVALFLSLMAYGLLTKAPNNSIDASLAKARPAQAPGFELPVLQRGSIGTRLNSKVAPALKDGQLTLSELSGTPVVLNFWASWCIPCRSEAPVLEGVWQQNRSKGVLFLGLNMQDLIPDARAFIRDFHNTYPNIRDQGNDTAHSWGVTGVPETFFITPRSKVVAHVIGVVSAAQLRQGIAAARSGQAISALTGGATRPTR